MSIYTHLTRRTWFLTLVTVLAAVWTVQAQQTQVAVPVRERPGNGG